MFPFRLFFLLYGTSSFVGYLMPTLSLSKDNGYTIYSLVGVSNISHGYLSDFERNSTTGFELAY